ncbi:MAG: hypothetical protein ED859_16875 [Desulfuromonadales bacterium]|nr:MAG: hypothetical protein ED859_16875 [Desulfuromonadales bacterium]
MMNKIVASVACIAALAGTANAGNVDFSVGINVGSRPTTVRYEPVYAPAPPPPVVIAEPPEFVLAPSLGFYAAVGVPYDLFYVGSRYYLSRGNDWYRGASYRGPWVTVEYRSLPWELRRYPVAKIRSYRDQDYRHRCDDDNRGRWGYYRSGRDWRDEKRRWKEARHWEKEQWKRGKGHGHHEDDDD